MAADKDQLVLEKLAHVAPYVDYILSSGDMEKLAGLDLVKIVPGVARAVKGATRASGNHIPSGPTIRMGTTRHIPSGPTIQIPSYEVGAYTGNVARGFGNTAGAAASGAANAAAGAAGSASKLPKTLPQQLLSGQRGFFGRLGEGVARRLGGGKNIDAYREAANAALAHKNISNSVLAAAKAGDTAALEKIIADNAKTFFGRALDPAELKNVAQWAVNDVAGLDRILRSGMAETSRHARSLAGAARAEASAYNSAAKLGTGIAAGGLGLTAGAYGLGHSNGVDSGVADFKANSLPKYLNRAAMIGNAVAQNQASNAGFMDRLGYLFTGSPSSIGMNGLAPAPSRRAGGFMA